jgi:hypothetical protein
MPDFIGVFMHHFLLTICTIRLFSELMLPQRNKESQPKRRRKIRFPKIVFHARQLNVNRSHLYRVLIGERESPGLLKRFRDVQRLDAVPT